MALNSRLYNLPAVPDNTGGTKEQAVGSGGTKEQAVGSGGTEELDKPVEQVL